MLLLRVMPGVLIHCVGKNLRIKPPDPHSMEVETGPQRGPWRIKYFLEDYLGNLSKSEPVCWFPFIHLETKHQTNVVYLTDPGKKMQSWDYGLCVYLIWNNDHLIKHAMHTHTHTKKTKTGNSVQLSSELVKFSWAWLNRFHSTDCVSQQRVLCLMRKMSQNLQNWAHFKSLQLFG